MDVGGEFSTFLFLRAPGVFGPQTDENVLLKVGASLSSTWELVRNAENQAPPQACGTRICILNRSLETCMHCGVKSTDVHKCLSE